LVGLGEPRTAQRRPRTQPTRPPPIRMRRLTQRYGLSELGGAAGVGGLAPPQPHRCQRRQGRFLPVVFVPAVFEDEEWLGVTCGCFGERDGFSEAFERERLALGDAQHFISDETADLGQRVQRILR
jgi:hypothetical protein